MLKAPTADLLFANLFHASEPSKEDHEMAHWQEIKQSIESDLRSEFLRRKNLYSQATKNDAQPVALHSLVLHRDPTTNQCTLFIRNIQANREDSYHQLIQEWKKKNTVFSQGISMTTLHALEKKSYAVCIQASSPEKMSIGLGKLLKIQ